MPSRKIMSRDQIEVFLKFMEQHVNFATNSYSNPGFEAKKQLCDLWDELAAKLSSIPGGAKRPGEAWRKFWNDKKYNIRRKIMEINKARLLGKPLKTKVTDEEIRIWDILNQPLNLGQDIKIEQESLSESEQTIEIIEHSPVSAIQSIDTCSDLNSVNQQETNITNRLESCIPNHLESSTPKLEPLTQNVVESGTKKLKPMRLYSKRQLVMLKRIAPKPMSGHPTKKVRLKEPESVDIHNEPPQWAKDMEDRRTTATERIAHSLEKLTSAIVGMQQSLITLTTDVAPMKKFIESRPP